MSSLSQLKTIDEENANNYEKLGTLDINKSEDANGKSVITN